MGKKKQHRRFLDAVVATLTNIVPDDATLKEQGVKRREAIAYAHGLAMGMAVESEVGDRYDCDDPLMYAVELYSHSLDVYVSDRDELLEKMKS